MATHLARAGFTTSVTAARRAASQSAERDQSCGGWGTRTGLLSGLARIASAQAMAFSASGATGSRPRLSPARS